MGKMLIVGITGRSGSGKSKVTEYYSRLGYPTVDGDQLSRQVTVPGCACLAELEQAFGGGIIAPDGTLLRKKLGEITFTDPKNNRLLMDITHPHILKEALRLEIIAEESGAKLFFVDGAMIVGGPFEAHCDQLIVVTSQTRLAVSRVMLRDGISKSAAHNRLTAQLPQERLLAAADYVIQNNGSEETLKRQADEILTALLRKWDAV